MADITNAKLVKDFRPVAVLPAIYKLYSRAMYMLTEPTWNRLVSTQFDSRKFHLAHEVVFIIRQMVEKAVEWRAPHVYIMDGDIKKAYDFASHVAWPSRWPPGSGGCMRSPSTPGRRNAEKDK